MTGADSAPAEARAALERRYDEPAAKIASLQESRPADSVVDGHAAIFTAFGNGHRLRILEALRGGERCGCELQVVLDAPQSTVATHLRTLKAAGLVRVRKTGKWRNYRIADGGVVEVLDLVRAIREGN